MSARVLCIGGMDSSGGAGLLRDAATLAATMVTASSSIASQFFRCPRIIAMATSSGSGGRRCGHARRTSKVVPARPPATMQASRADVPR